MLLEPKGRKAVIGAAIAIVLLAAGVVVYALTSEDSPIQLASPWPQADSERVVPKPQEPAVWPLTGLPVSDPDVPKNTRIVSVKIENSPVSRPQSGIQSADLVYESITEGGITRFNCMFHSTDPGEVGPVRSARLSDIDIVPQYDALFAFSGASSSVNAAIKSARLQNLSQDIGVSRGYRRSSQRSSPHNLYLTLATARDEGVKRGFPAKQVIRRLQFDKKSAESSAVVSEITIPFSPANTSQWTYDTTNDYYLRENNGKSHNDQITGSQVHARNVVVMWATTSAVSKRDVTGSATYDIELVGSNRVSVFRNGKRFDGTWTAAKAAPPTFKAADGTAIRLAPGNTWFQVVPTNVNIRMQ
ncbi:MAG: DUF3048 domain-containing protein [Coriobacteriia bacterium]